MPDLAGGVATGIGSLPGTDVALAVSWAFDETPDLPYLPELPARGPGADMIGRGAAILVDLPVELYAGRWQVTARSGRDLRVARDHLTRDLDTLTDTRSDHDGPVKVSVAGPWTLAAALRRPIGGAMLRDPGAVRDVVDSLREGVAGLVAQVSARLPAAQVVLQLDEPSLPAVLAGEIPTESGLSAYPRAEAETVRAALGGIGAAAGVPLVVHCCAPDVPVSLLAAGGAAAVALDLSLVDMDDAAALDELGEALDGGLKLFAGVVPATPAPPDPDDGAEPSPLDREGAELVARLWSRLGLARSTMAEQVVITPSCGLASADVEYARTALRACREAAKRLRD